MKIAIIWTADTIKDPIFEIMYDNIEDPHEIALLKSPHGRYSLTVHVQVTVSS